MSNKQNGSGNEYRCAIEKNQNGKYTVRVRAAFGTKELGPAGLFPGVDV